MLKYLKLRYLLFVIVLICGLSAYYFELTQWLTVENMRQLDEQLGWWSPLVFALAFVVGELLQVPSILWILFAGIIWPWWIALPIATASALLAALVSFLVARYFLGKQFHSLLPAAVQKLNKQISKQPLRTVIVLRLTTFLHPITHWILAASRVTLGPFMIGTTLGILPGVLGIVLLGEAFVLWWEDYSLFIILAAIIGIAALVLSARRRKNKLDRQQDKI